MLSSAVRLVSEQGYQKLSVARVARGARVSRRTFYDVFDSREDCFLAAFEEAVMRAGWLVTDAYAGPRETSSWQARVRAALSALLVFLDEEPEMRCLLIVDAIKAGPGVLARRSEILERLGTIIHEGGTQARSLRSQGRGSHGLPPLTGEGVVSAVLGMVHSRLLQREAGSMVELLNPLMSVIVLPYLGPAAAQRELKRPVPTAVSAAGAKDAGGAGSVGDLLAGLPMRLTYRTLRVLHAIADQSAEGSNPSNREIAELAGISDQGQISKLLARLRGLGLVQNTSAGGPQPTGEPNAWHLTLRGKEIEWGTRAPSVDEKGRKSMERGSSRLVDKFEEQA